MTRSRTLAVVLMAFCFLTTLIGAQETGPFEKVTIEMRALRATFLTGVNQETCAGMLQNVTRIRGLLEILFQETVAKDNAQAGLISALDRDLEMLRFQLVNAVGESIGVAGALKIVLEDFIKLRDLRTGKK